MALIDAYRKDTGDKVRIPEHWLTHRRLGEPFAKTPRQKAADRKTLTPTPAAGDTTKEK